MYRDKDYLLTSDGLIFNVIGYDHRPDRATVNLKYAHGRKWTNGYVGAIDFLKQAYPHYVGVDDIIAVSTERITKTYEPQKGLRELLCSRCANRLQQVAIELIRALADFFEISIGSFGITDSLLWSRGTDESDVDVAVYGKTAATRILKNAKSLFRDPRFERLGIENFSRRSSGMLYSELEQLCLRKINKGLFQGTRYSIRAVRDFREISPSSPYSIAGPVCVTGRIADSSESLFFPAIYTFDSGIQVVSFLTEHEAAFLEAEMIEVSGILESLGRPSKCPANDRIVVGGLRGRNEGINVLKALV